MPTGEERDYTVRAVDRVCAILNLLQQSVDGVSMGDVAEITNLPKSSAFRYLWTLQKHRYVESDPITGLFRLGLGFVGMQSRQLEVLRERARPYLEKLRDCFDETTNLGILDGDTVVYLDVLECRRSVRLAVSRGDRDALHSTALGKAIAAHLPDARVREILRKSGMPRSTANTITTIDGFRKELANVRANGYAVDDAENELDGRCVAVPLQGTRLPAAISLSAPAARFLAQDVPKVAAELMDIAHNIAAVSSGVQ